MNKKTIIIVVLCVVVMVIAGGIRFLWRMGNNVGYAPEQPIPFSHKLHGGDLQIPCAYCHIGVETSKHAVVPAVNICMNCHTVVKTESPLIQKLKGYADRNESIPWVKVHDIPDHARFTHERHIAKNVACEECHGDVKTMARIKQVKTLQMGFCVECHRKADINASINCESCHY